MTVFTHDLPRPDDPLPCTTFVSERLIALGQKEMLFTLSRGATADEADPQEFADDVVRFLRRAHYLASEGRRVDVGDISEFGLTGGPDRVRGVCYLTPEWMTGVAVPLSALALIPLVGDEVDAVKVFGFTRVMARLGAHYRYFPCPPWWERNRPVIAVHEEDVDSVLGKCRRWSFAGVCARLQGRCVVLRVPAGSRDALARTLAEAQPDAVPALTLELDPEADGLLVWTPGQPQRSATTPPGSRAERLSLCFLAFAPGQAQDYVSMREDGAVAVLTSTSWTRLLAAVSNAEPVTIDPTADGYALTIEPIPDVYVSRMDGRAYRGHGEWRAFHPQPARPEVSDGVFRLSTAALLTGPDKLPPFTAIDSLTSYGDRIVRAIQEYFGVRPAGSTFVLRADVYPSGHVHLSAVGDIDEYRLVRLLRALPVPAVRGGPIRFELVLTATDDSTSV